MWWMLGFGSRHLDVNVSGQTNIHQVHLVFILLPYSGRQDIQIITPAFMWSDHPASPNQPLKLVFWIHDDDDCGG